MMMMMMMMMMTYLCVDRCDTPVVTWSSTWR